MADFSNTTNTSDSRDDESARSAPPHDMSLPSEHDSGTSTTSDDSQPNNDNMSETVGEGEEEDEDSEDDTSEEDWSEAVFREEAVSASPPSQPPLLPVLQEQALEERAKVQRMLIAARANINDNFFYVLQDDPSCVEVWTMSRSATANITGIKLAVAEMRICWPGFAEIMKLQQRATPSQLKRMLHLYRTLTFEHGIAHPDFVAKSLAMTIFGEELDIGYRCVLDLSHLQGIMLQHIDFSTWW